MIPIFLFNFVVLTSLALFSINAPYDRILASEKLARQAVAEKSKTNPVVFSGGDATTFLSNRNAFAQSIPSFSSGQRRVSFTKEKDFVLRNLTALRIF